MLQTFSTQLDTLPSHFPRVSSHPTSTKATVCDTKPTYCSTIRNPSFLCSNKFCFSHFSSVSPFHSNTSVNCMHFLVSIIFLFGAMLFVFLLSLNFTTFCTVTIIPLYLTFLFLESVLGFLVVLFASHQSCREALRQCLLPPPILEVDFYFGGYIASVFSAHK